MILQIQRTEPVTLGGGLGARILHGLGTFRLAAGRPKTDTLPSLPGPSPHPRVIIYFLAFHPKHVRFSHGCDHTNRLVRRDIQSMGRVSTRLDRVRPLLCGGAPFVVLRQRARSVGRRR